MKLLDGVDRTKKHLSDIGRESKILLGKQTDSELLDFLIDNPGVTMFDASKALGWTIGKVQGAVTRLEKSEQVVLEKVLKDGRVVNLLYPASYKNAPDIIEIDKELLNEPEQWTKQLNLYAMNRSTIVITPEPTESLEKNSFYKSTVVPNISNDKIVVKLPVTFVDFYQLQISDRDIASTGKEVFVTINSVIKSLISEDHPNLPTDYKVVIMEDDKKYARALRSALYKYFRTIELAFTEGEVKEKIELNKPDYLILDWDILNKKAAERILNWMKGKRIDIPAAIITSQDYDEKDEKRFKEEGFDVFYDKETSQLPKVLSSRILRVLQNKGIIDR